MEELKAKIAQNEPAVEAREENPYQNTLNQNLTSHQTIIASSSDVNVFFMR
jgi:hypothetical protein